MENPISPLAWRAVLQAPAQRGSAVTSAMARRGSECATVNGRRIYRKPLVPEITYSYYDTTLSNLNKIGRQL
jgi:hypothetical protein